MVCGHPYSIPETGVRPAKHRPDQVTRGEFYPTVFSIARLFCELSVQNEKCLCVRLQLHPNRSEHFSPYAVLSPDKESIGIVTGCNRKLLLRYTGRRRGGRARLAGELRVSAAPRRKSGSYRGPRGFVAKRARGGWLSPSQPPDSHSGAGRPAATSGTNGTATRWSERTRCVWWGTKVPGGAPADRRPGKGAR